MSGLSYTYVRNTELSHLRNLARDAVNLSNRNQELEERLRTQRYENQNRIQHLERTAQDLEDRLNHQVATASKERQQLRSQLRKTVADTNAALADMANRNKQALNKQEQNFRSALLAQKKDAARALKESHDQLQAEMRATANTLNARINETNAGLKDVNDTLSRMVSDNRSLLEQAQELGGTAETILDAATQLRLDLLLPGRRKKAADLLATAQANIATAETNSANSSVARLTASQAAQGALQLYQDAMHAEQVWQQAWQQAARSLDAAEVQLEACRHYKLPIRFEDGSEQVYDVDGTLWSGGDLQQLSDRLRALRDQLNHADATLTASQLDDLCEAGAQLAHEAVESAQFSVAAFDSSQDRADWAGDIADEIAPQLGLQVQSHGYQGGDMRATHHLCLKNPTTGLQVAVTQIPELRNGELQNRIEAEVLDYGTLHNPAEGDIIARNILNAIKGMDDDPDAAAVCTVSTHESCNDHPTRTAVDVQHEIDKPVAAEELLTPAHTPL